MSRPPPPSPLPGGVILTRFLILHHRTLDVIYFFHNKINILYYEKYKECNVSVRVLQREKAPPPPSIQNHHSNPTPMQQWPPKKVFWIRLWWQNIHLNCQPPTYAESRRLYTSIYPYMLRRKLVSIRSSFWIEYKIYTCTFYFHILFILFLFFFFWSTFLDRSVSVSLYMERVVD